MKKLILAAGVAMAALTMAAPASASDLNLTGEVGIVCSVTPTGDTVTFALAGTGGGATGSYIWNVYCNQKFDANVELEHGRLLNVDAPPASVNPEGDNNYYSGPFAVALDYTIEAVGYGAPVSTATIPGNTLIPLVSNADPVNTVVNLNFVTVGGGQLTAGTYEDTITVNISPDGL